MTVEMIIQALAAGVATAAFSVIFGVKGLNVLIASISGTIGYFLYLYTDRIGSLFSIVLASAAISLFAEVAARFRRAPATLFLVAGLRTIVPGASVYRGMLFAIEGNSLEAGSTLLNALLETGAIAVGIIIISSLLELVPLNRLAKNDKIDRQNGN